MAVQQSRGTLCRAPVSASLLHTTDKREKSTKVTSAFPALLDPGEPECPCAAHSTSAGIPAAPHERYRNSDAWFRGPVILMSLVCASSAWTTRATIELPTDERFGQRDDSWPAVTCILSRRVARYSSIQPCRETRRAAIIWVCPVCGWRQENRGRARSQCGCGQGDEEGLLDGSEDDYGWPCLESSPEGTSIERESPR